MCFLCAAYQVHVKKGCFHVPLPVIYQNVFRSIKFAIYLDTQIFCIQGLLWNSILACDQDDRSKFVCKHWINGVIFNSFVCKKCVWRHILIAMTIWDALHNMFFNPASNSIVLKWITRGIHYNGYKTYLAYS